MIIIWESQTVIWESETLNPESGKTLHKNYRYLSVLRLILSVPIRLTKGNTEQKHLIHKWIYLNSSYK